MKRERQIPGAVESKPGTVYNIQYTGFSKIYVFSCLLLAVACSLFWGSCNWGKPKEAKGDIAALVNGEAITRKDLAGELKRLEAKENDSSAEGKQVQIEALARLIERKLLLQQAAAREIRISEQELQAAVKEYSKDYSAEDFSRQLKEHQLTLGEWQASLQEELLLRKLEDEVVRQGGGISDQEALNYYQRHPGEFQQEEQIRARHIMVKDKKEAEAILARLRQGADFTQLAKERSQTPDAALGGDLGYFRRGQMPEGFDVAFTLRNGQISGVVHSPYGYHIFKTEDRRRSHKKNFDEAVGEIKTKLALSQKEEALARWMEEIKNKAEININPIYGIATAPEPAAKK